MAWAACGKNSPPSVGAGVEGDHADRAGLDPAVAAAAFPGGDADLFPGQRAQPAQQRGLVQLRREQVVAAAFVQVVGVVAVGVGGVGGDQDIGQVQVVEQRGERGDLAALLLDRDLPEDRTAGLVEHRHQMRLPIATVITAPVLALVVRVTVDGAGELPSPTAALALRVTPHGGGGSQELVVGHDVLGRVGRPTGSVRLPGRWQTG